MLIRLIAAAAPLALATSALAAAPAARPTTEERVEVRRVITNADGASVPSDETKALIAKCDGRKFETSAELGTGKEKRITKIKLCAKGGESDAEWAASLQKAIERLDDVTEIAPESRAKITAELQAELARVKGAK